jgi:acyl dehydratase
VEVAEVELGNVAESTPSEIGRPLIRFPVEAGQILLFARAIGDFNPIYADEAYARTTPLGGIIAPPTFVQSSAQYDPDYRVRPKPGEAWFGSGRTPSGLPEISRGDGILHAEQHFEQVRPLRPGEVLCVRVCNGATWTKQGRKGGAMTFRETITEFCGEDGEVVVTSRSVTVKTGDEAGRDKA